MVSSTNNVLLVGGGGREHALAWKLAQSPRVRKIFVIPGNAGIASLGDNVECVDLKLDKDYSMLIAFCRENKVNLVTVGPEEHLEKGIVDALEKNGIMCFGPTAEAAKLETSKAFAKDFLRKTKIPTARYVTFTDSQKAIEHIRNCPYKALVVKASGLAAGKGVTVAKDIDEACRAVRESLDDKKFKDAGSKIVVEELLNGVEVSALAFSDGETVRLMPFSQDHKQLLDGDKGPNTGGMGAYAPVLINREHSKIIEKDVLEKAVRCMKEAGTPYKGVLYAGIMITKNGPQVLEFNCRFGDPETQVLMRFLKSDLYEIMVCCCQQKLSSCNVEWVDDQVVCGVVLASGGYPESYEKGFPISGLDEVTKFEKSAYVFHCGTKVQNKNGTTKNNIPEVVSWGGRVLCVTASGLDLNRAYRNAYCACARIYFEKCQYRHDIGAKSLRPSPTSYSKSGVSIDRGNELVDKIKNFCSSTNRPGCASQIGGFGAVFDLKAAGYEDPILVAGTDGVGTKLKVAQEIQHHSQIGCDLVAMCVNDILVHNAESLLFLDYYATGKLNVDQATQVIQGIAHGCHVADCALAGGETAEMPDFYEKEDYDLAGFVLGCVDRKNSGFPNASKIKPGDIVIGLPSSGLHSNGFSLARKVVKDNNLSYWDPCPWTSESANIGLDLLTPTKIYVKSLLPILRSGLVNAAAHITGGGLLENIPRVLPENVEAVLDARKWEIPPIFKWISSKGRVQCREMIRTFNCGIGIVLIVPTQNVPKVKDMLVNAKEAFFEIGSIEASKSIGPGVSIKGLETIFDNFQSADASTYAKSGVNIDEGTRLVSNIKTFCSSTKRAGCIDSIGGFGASFDLKGAGYEDPIVVAGTDGVGTKLKIAQQMQRHETIGQDLVAMCVNDILVHNAEPLFFLDYYATGKLNVDVATEVIKGICDGCKLANCALIGGETAEMPGFYEKADYDLAGFAVGCVERSQSRFPNLENIKNGHVILGLASSGLHSNGFSLVRDIVENIAHLSYTDRCPWSDEETTIGDELLKPTKIYVRSVLGILRSGLVDAAAHITGGGLFENLPRVLPKHLRAELDTLKWDVPKMYEWLAFTGSVDPRELMRTLNCGIGMALIIPRENVEKVGKMLTDAGETFYNIGSVIPRKDDQDSVVVRNLGKFFNYPILPAPLKEKIRVAVLISGTGSNMVALWERTLKTNSLCQIICVLSNKDDVKGVEFARQHGIPCRIVSHSGKSREVFDQEIDQVLESFDVELVCLAGFMRILTENFTKKWQGRMLNVHPSLLPLFKGHDAIRQALEAKVSETGSTVHFVSPEVDAGAIIVQSAVKIDPSKDTETDVAERLKSRVEHKIFPSAMESVAAGRVILTNDGRAFRRKF